MLDVWLPNCVRVDLKPAEYKRCAAELIACRGQELNDIQRSVVSFLLTHPKLRDLCYDFYCVGGDAGIEYNVPVSMENQLSRRIIVLGAEQCTLYWSYFVVAAFNYSDPKFPAGLIRILP